MRGDNHRWKLVCLVGFSATVSTGLLAAPPAVKYAESAFTEDAEPGQEEKSAKPVSNNADKTDPTEGAGPGEEKRDAKVQNVLRDALIAPDKARETGDPILDGVLEVIQERGSVVAAWLPETFDFEATGKSKDLPNPKLPQPPHSLPPSHIPQYAQAQQFALPQQHSPQQHVPQQHSPQQHAPQPPFPWVHQISPGQPGQGQLPNYPGLYSHQPPPPVLPPNNDYGRGGVHDSMSSPQHEQQFLLAEQLLMTARLLSADLDQQRGHGFSNDRGRDEGQRRQLIRMLREEAARCLNTQSRTHVQPPSVQPPAPHANQLPHFTVPVY